MDNRITDDPVHIVPTYSMDSFTLLEQGQDVKNEKMNGKYTVRTPQFNYISQSDASVDIQIDTSLDAQTTKNIYFSNQRLSGLHRDALSTGLAQQEIGIRARYLEIDRVQAKINGMMGEMKGLNDSLLKQEAVADSYRAMLAPIRLLPPELLMRIFGFVLPDKVSPRRCSSPLGLTHVCSIWRSAALASYGLWNNLHLNLECDEPSSEILSSLIPSWFGRAHPASPLSFSLRNIQDLDDVTSLRKGITPFLDRLSELRSEGGTFEDVEDVFDISNTPLTQLETLVLGSPHEDPEYGSTMTIHAPRLHTATLNIASIILADPHTFIFPWSQLTTLHLPGEITVYAFSRIIFQCKLLQEASFNISFVPDPSMGDPFEDPIIPQQPITFPNLSNFKVDLVGRVVSQGLGTVLGMICLPALQTLHYAGGVHLCIFAFNEPLFRRTMQHIGGLRNLTLTRISIELPDLIALLCACPLLEYLSLRMAGVAAVSESTLRLLRTGSTISDEDGSDSEDYETDSVEDGPGRTEDETTKPTFVHLKSFTFVLVYSYTFALAVDEFTELVLLWIRDSSRMCPLQTVTLVVRCQPDEQADIEQAVDDVRRRLKPWARAEDDRSGILFQFKIVQYPSDEELSSWEEKRYRQ